MKKFFILVFAMVIASVSAFADNGKVYHKDVLGNSFGDNWELSVGVGTNYTAWDKFGFKQGDFVDNVGFGVDVSATKWINPIFGFRLGFDMGEQRVYDFNRVNHSLYLIPHVDGMVNLSNWIGGYREDRFYYATIFGGIGLNTTNVGNDANYGIAGSFGLKNTFRVSDAVDLNIELKSYVMSGHDMMRQVSVVSGKVGQVYTATVGATIRFGKRGWSKGVPSYVASEYLAHIDMLSRDLDNESAVNTKNIKKMNDYEERINALSAENNDLRNTINNHKCTTATYNSTITVFFDFDSYKLTKKSKVAIDLFVDSINDSNDKFVILGYADNETGTDEYNRKLSENRAKAVYDYLINSGLSSDRLTYQGLGASNQFDGATCNRVVLIK